MAAITGLSSASSASGILCTWVSSSALRSRGVRSPRFRISPMSPPLQKALPAPVTITTETASLLRHSASASAQASIISQVKAFMRSGRLRVMVAIPLSISNRMLSVMRVSSGGARHRQDRPSGSAHQQSADQDEVQDIECDAEREGGLVIGEPVIERPAHPCADRHADQTKEEDRADAPAGFARREQVAHRQHIAGDD